MEKWRAFRNSPRYEDAKGGVVKKGKNLLMTILQIILIVGISYVILSPVIGIVSQSFFSDADIIYYGVKMLVAYMLSGPFIGILFVNMNCLQSTGNAFPATILSVLRQGLLLILVLYLLNAKARIIPLLRLLPMIINGFVAEIYLTALTGSWMNFLKIIFPYYTSVRQRERTCFRQLIFWSL